MSGLVVCFKLGEQDNVDSQWLRSFFPRQTCGILIIKDCIWCIMYIIYVLIHRHIHLMLRVGTIFTDPFPESGRKRYFWRIHLICWLQSSPMEFYRALLRQLEEQHDVGSWSGDSSDDFSCKDMAPFALNMHNKHYIIGISTFYEYWYSHSVTNASCSTDLWPNRPDSTFWGRIRLFFESRHSLNHLGLFYSWSSADMLG